MDIRSIRKLIEIVEQSDIAEIEIKEGEHNIRISRSTQQPAMVAAPVAAAPIVAAAPVAPVAAAPMATTVAPAAEVVSGTPVTSPMVGSFYAAGSPDADAFVKVGDQVSVGDTLCIIEAMKIMNPIESEVAGTIKQIMVQNADPVEFGQTLFIIE